MLRRNVLTPFLSGLAGAAIVVALFLALGIGGETKQTTTTIQQTPLARPASDRDVSGLTPREIYKRDAPGVVFIRAQVVEKTSPSPFDPFPNERKGEATGSGFVISGDGTIITNAHVVEGAQKVTVQFENDKTSDAKVVGRDESTDIAVLSVDPSGLDLQPLTLGDSSSVAVGDPVLAIGNPFGLDRTLTQGIVSALQRQIKAPNGFSIDNVVQTDAAINPGNSGGPLIDAAGRVVGINSQIQTGGSGDGNVGIGFAVPIDTAKHIVPQLKADGKVERAYLGVRGATVDAALKTQVKLPGVDKGVLVDSVTPGSPAQKAGVKGTTQSGSETRPGDVIVKLDDTAVTTSEQVVDFVTGKKPGDEVKVEVVRDGKPKTFTVTLATRPSKLPGN